MNKKRGIIILGTLLFLVTVSMSLLEIRAREASDTPVVSALYSSDLHHWLLDEADGWATPRYILVYSRPGQLSTLLERLRLEDYAVLHSNDAQQRALLRLSTPEELVRLQRIDSVSVVSSARPPLTTIEMRRLNARKSP